MVAHKDNEGYFLQRWFIIGLICYVKIILIWCCFIEDYFRTQVTKDVAFAPWARAKFLTNEVRWSCCCLNKVAHTKVNQLINLGINETKKKKIQVKLFLGSFFAQPTFYSFHFTFFYYTLCLFTNLLFCQPTQCLLYTMLECKHEPV